jgi:hypothetical protein
MAEGGYFLFTLGNRNRVTDFDDPLRLWTARKLEEIGLLAGFGNSIIREFTILLKKDSKKVPKLDFGVVWERSSTNSHLWVRNDYTDPNAGF